jgi:hypothetical protein
MLLTTVNRMPNVFRHESGSRMASWPGPGLPSRAGHGSADGAGRVTGRDHPRVGARPSGAEGTAQVGLSLAKLSVDARNYRLKNPELSASLKDIDKCER